MGKPPKIIAFVMNLIVIALCAVAISAYFIQPLFSFSAKITLTPELMDFVKSEVSEDGTIDAEDGEISEDEIIDEVLTQLGKDRISISAGIELKTLDVLSALSASDEDTKQNISQIIESNVNGILDSFSSSIEKVVESLSKSVVKVSVKSTLKAEIEKHEIKNDDGTTMSVDEVLTDLGLTDEYLDSATEQLIESMKAENATPDSIADEAVKVVNQVIETVNKSANGEDAKEAYKNLNLPEKLDEESEQQVRDVVSEILNEYADENGNVNLDNILYTFIGQALDGQNSDGNTDNEARTEDVYVVTSLSSVQADTDAATGETKKQYTKEDVQLLLHDKVMENVTDDLLAVITTVLKVVAGIILFTFVVWAWLVFKIIVKLFCANPMIKLWLPIWFGNVLFPILYALPAAIAFLVSNITSLPASITGYLQSTIGESAYSTFVSIGNSISLTANSCLLITFITTIVLFVYSIIYWIVRNKYKRAA